MWLLTLNIFISFFFYPFSYFRNLLLFPWLWFFSLNEFKCCQCTYLKWFFFSYFCFLCIATPCMLCLQMSVMVFYFPCAKHITLPCSCTCQLSLFQVGLWPPCAELACSSHAGFRLLFPKLQKALCDSFLSKVVNRGIELSFCWVKPSFH